MAYQIGGEALYREVEDDAASYAAPGKNYFEALCRDRKVLVMIDELAQYAARLSAVKTDGSEQLASFLMSLHEYARSNPGMAIILTLASQTDAFARQTGELSKLLTSITGREVNSDEALAIGQQAVEGVASVVARDATSVVPVQANEISRVRRDGRSTSAPGKRFFCTALWDATRVFHQTFSGLPSKTLCSKSPFPGSHPPGRRGAQGNHQQRLLPEI